ncbi:MAG: hypothetical protein LVQ95_04770 [Candidatus Micrarchaeales archaeon]|nr:hypothetical protein [Candidatus Micrarchaeales archaeon]
MDFGKMLSDKKMKMALAVTAIAFVLFLIAPYGEPSPFSLFESGLGDPGYSILILVTTLAMLFYGLGYVQKEKSKESIPFLDSRNVIAIALIIVLLIAPAVLYQSPDVTLIAVQWMQWIIFGILIVALDHYALKNSIASGINFFMVAIFAATFLQWFLFQLDGAASTLSSGGNSALATTLINFAPTFFTIIIFFLGYRVFKTMKAQRHVAGTLFNGSGRRIPIPFLYPVYFSYILAGFLISIVFTGIILANGTNNDIWITYAQTQQFGQQSSVPVGGIVYLFSDNGFPLPFAAPYGIGGYAAYMNYLGSSASNLYLSGTNVVLVPEYMHALLSSLLLIVVSVLIAWAWTKLIARRLKLEHLIPRREWLFGSAAVAFLASLTPILGLSPGMVAAAAVVYFLREVVSAKP